MTESRNFQERSTGSEHFRAVDEALPQKICRESKDASAYQKQKIPDVSFLVASYNSMPFIEQCIASALGQKGVSVEVIVVDGGSNDGTVEYVNMLSRSDQRIRLMINEHNNSPGANRNCAIEIASGRWLAVLDSDDLIAPERTLQLLNLAIATSADIVADNFERVTVDCCPTGVTMFQKRSAPFSFLVDSATLMLGNLALVKPRLSLGAIKPMIASRFVNRHRLRFREELPIGEDYQFLLEALLKDARFVVTSEDYYKYRMRPGSQSWRLKPGQLDLLIQAHPVVDIGLRAPDCKKMKSAAAFHLRALERSRNFVALVDMAKSGRTAGALFYLARTPSIWGLAGRFGSDALMKRVRGLLVEGRISHD